MLVDVFDENSKEGNFSFPDEVLIYSVKVLDEDQSYF